MTRDPLEVCLAVRGVDDQKVAMGVEQVMVLTTVEFDTVDKSAFEPPAAIKALIK